MLGKRLDFNQTDLDIIAALEMIGGKASSREISDSLNIPVRTVRYRIRRLKKLGYLRPTRVKTHERKLGLGENIILFHEPRMGNPFPRTLLDSIPPFYWHGSTYGKFNGFVVHSMYDLATPNANLDLMKTMQSSDLIGDYYIFDIVDYYSKGWDLTSLTPGMDWRGSWDSWINQIDEAPRKKSGIKLPVDLKPKIVDYDSRDISILRHLAIDPNTTLNQISDAMDISISQVHRRIIRLEKVGVIRGYKSIFTPFDNPITLVWFIESEDSMQAILSYLYKIPFALEILFESFEKVCVIFSLAPGDITKLLKGIDRIRHWADSNFLQTTHDGKRGQLGCIYDLYDENIEKWRTHDESNFNIINQFC